MAHNDSFDVMKRERRKWRISLDGVDHRQLIPQRDNVIVAKLPSPQLERTPVPRALTRSFDSGRNSLSSQPRKVSELLKRANRLTSLQPKTHAIELFRPVTSAGLTT